jgi:ElaB/YqjD/DUF883 family membrane-anchored ribosome-binding protein
MEQGTTATGTAGAKTKVPAGGSSSTLMDKLETLEQGVRDTAQGANAAVADTAEGLKVATQSTVRAVQGAVHDSAQALGRAFDLPAHVRRHPWLMVGGAVLAGVVVGRLAGRRRR